VNQPETSQAASILVVDDQWINRELMETILSGYGFSVLLAHSGEHALEMVAAHQPNLVLVDLRMPDMDGCEVTRHIKTNPQTRDTVVIIVTALELNSEDHRQIEEAAADGLISRMTPAAELVKIINQHLNRQHPGV